MIWIVKYLWLIPALPLFAAGIIAVNKQPARKLADQPAVIKDVTPPATFPGLKRPAVYGFIFIRNH